VRPQNLPLVVPAGTSTVHVLALVHGVSKLACHAHLVRVLGMQHGATMGCLGHSLTRQHSPRQTIFLFLFLFFCILGEQFYFWTGRLDMINLFLERYGQRWSMNRSRQIQHAQLIANTA
jgi:hypothetical protein